MRLRYALAIAMLALVLTTSPHRAAAFEYQWRDSHDVMHSLKDSNGKPRILHFWASWCPPCRAELPDLTAWEKQHPGIDLIPISLDENVGDAESFLSSNHLHIPILSGDIDQAMQLGIRALPTTIIIGADGKVVARYVGALPWSDPAFSKHILESFPSRQAPQQSTPVAFSAPR